MGREYPLSLSGFTVLPLELPPLPSLPKAATHFLYLQPHQPRIPDPDSSRSLFLVNVPITATEAHFKHFFGTQLCAGRVESVRFQDVQSTSSAPVVKPSAQLSKGKKRKRETVEELEQELKSIRLPKTWDRELQNPGAHAVVVFVDKPSMEASLKAAKKAAKSRTKIVWGQGIEDKLPPLGSQRYEHHNRLRYPPREELKRIANEYMLVFDRLEEARAREATTGAQVSDEDGFITVVKGPKHNPDREDELKALAEKQKEKNKGLEDFYRFQTREMRKEKQNELLKGFEEDKKKVEEMKKRRGKIRPE
ncbi:Ribosomal RNA-processing protein 7 [Coccidioides immitis]|nr:Ribosomal RNA-processing protein 7 [Coccidioides immitis]